MDTILKITDQNSANNYIQDYEFTDLGTRLQTVFWNAAMLWTISQRDYNTQLLVKTLLFFYK